MHRFHDFAGEAIGACILVFFGCGSAAAATPAAPAAAVKTRADSRKR